VRSPQAITVTASGLEMTIAIVMSLVRAPVRYTSAIWAEPMGRHTKIIAYEY